jgi:hypothetical protein
MINGELRRVFNDQLLQQAKERFLLARANETDPERIAYMDGWWAGYLEAVKIVTRIEDQYL